MFLTMYPGYLVPVVIGITGIDGLLRYPTLCDIVILLLRSSQICYHPLLAVKIISASVLISVLTKLPLICHRVSKHI